MSINEISKERNNSNTYGQYGQRKIKLKNRNNDNSV